MTVKINGTNTAAAPAFTGADTDTGLQCGTNELKLVTGGTARATIDDSGRLMLGTTTEGEHTADDLTVATSGDTGISIRSGTSSSGKLFFSDGTSSADEYRGFVQYSHSNNTMSFGTDSTERLQIDNSGQVILGPSIGSGNSSTLRITGGTNGASYLEMGDTDDADVGQIAYYHSSNAMGFRAAAGERMRLTANGLTFNGDTAAANALSDYEEGTFTPTINTGFSVSYNSQQGRYTKIGDLVYVYINIDLGALSGSDSYAYATVNGLPFTAADNGNVDTGIIVAWQMNLGNNVEHAYVNGNETRLVLLGANSGGSRFHLTPSQVWDDADCRIALSGAYRTTA